MHTEPKFNIVTLASCVVKLPSLLCSNSVPGITDSLNNPIALLVHDVLSIVTRIYRVDALKFGKRKERLAVRRLLAIDPV